MAYRWKNLLCKALIWLIAEIFLSILGMDDLADYSEFIFERKKSILIAK